MSNSLTTEATILANLVEWSEDYPAWQRDALRRLCTAPDLDDTDATELLLAISATTNIVAAPTIIGSSAVTLCLQE